MENIKYNIFLLCIRIPIPLVRITTWKTLYQRLSDTFIFDQHHDFADHYKKINACRAGWQDPLRCSFFS